MKSVQNEFALQTDKFKSLQHSVSGKLDLILITF